jgi:hypothetical protein
MNATDISTAVSLLAALSVATERLVEIIKGSIPWLNKQASSADQEGWRQAVLHLLAAVAGIVTALLARSGIKGMVPAGYSDFPGILVLGLLASGGSGFWNSILTYLKAAKDVKEAAAPPLPK